MPSSASTQRCSARRSYRATASGSLRHRATSDGARGSPHLGSTDGQRSCSGITWPSVTLPVTYCRRQSSQKACLQPKSTAASAGGASHMQIGQVISAGGRIQPAIGSGLTTRDGGGRSTEDAPWSSSRSMGAEEEAPIVWRSRRERGGSGWRLRWGGGGSSSPVRSTSTTGRLRKLICLSRPRPQALPCLAGGGARGGVHTLTTVRGGARGRRLMRCVYRAVQRQSLSAP